MSKYAIKKGPNGKADFTSSKYTLTKNGEIMTVNQAGLKEIPRTNINNTNRAIFNSIIAAPADPVAVADAPAAPADPVAVADAPAAPADPVAVADAPADPVVGSKPTGAAEANIAETVAVVEAPVVPVVDSVNAKANANAKAKANEAANTSAAIQAVANANANAKAKANAAKEEANTAAAIKAVANLKAKEEANATAAAIKAVANSKVNAPSGSATSGSATSGSSGPSVPVPTPGPSGSVSNATNQQKLIQVTKNGSDHTATTLESKPVLSESDINAHKSKINANTQLVKIVQNGTAITGELIQSAPTKGGKYKKHTMKRKAKKSKKTRRH
jgi:hypothetical protein